VAVVVDAVAAVLRARAADAGLRGAALRVGAVDLQIAVVVLPVGAVFGLAAAIRASGERRAGGIVAVLLAVAIVVFVVAADLGGTAVATLRVGARLVVAV